MKRVLEARQRGRVEGKNGREEWKGRMVGKNGREEWKGRLGLPTPDAPVESPSPWAKSRHSEKLRV
jgi:hypothetical protein